MTCSLGPDLRPAAQPAGDGPPGHLCLLQWGWGEGFVSKSRFSQSFFWEERKTCLACIPSAVGFLACLAGWRCPSAPWACLPCPAPLPLGRGARVPPAHRLPHSDQGAAAICPARCGEPPSCDLSLGWGPKATRAGPGWRLSGQVTARQASLTNPSFSPSLTPSFGDSKVTTKWSPLSRSSG